MLNLNPVIRLKDGVKCSQCEFEISCDIRQKNSFAPKVCCTTIVRISPQFQCNVRTPRHCHPPLRVDLIMLIWRIARDLKDRTWSHTINVVYSWCAVTYKLTQSLIKCKITLEGSLQHDFDHKKVKCDYLAKCKMTQCNILRFNRLSLEDEVLKFTGTLGTKLSAKELVWFWPWQ